MPACRAALAVLLLIGAAPAQAREEGPAKLKEVEALFAAGDFESASRGINDILIQDQSLPAEGRARVFLMKARLELAYGRLSEIRLWLAKAHAVSPNLTLDPVKDPPQLVATWEELKHEGGAATVESKPMGGGVGNFYIGLLPLGVGHFDAGRFKDGLLFTTSEALFLLASSLVESKANQRVLGGMSFLGAYGYELFDLIPNQVARDAEAAQTLRYSLSFLPFGVAQAKNGEFIKAFGIATAQSVLLTVGVMSPGESQRNVALGLFAASWSYGILDGIANHQDKVAGLDGESPFSVSFTPVQHDDVVAAALVTQYDF